MPKIGKKNYYAFNFAMGLQFQSKALPELDMKRDKKQILKLVKIKEKRGEERITFVPTL